MLTAVDRRGQSASLVYDPLNRPIGATYADGSTVGWTYDAVGRLTQAQDSLGGTISRSYDGLDRLASETSAQGTVGYTYDADGRRLTMTVPGQAQVNYTWDNAGRLTGISQGSTAVSFGYDAAGRRISATLPGGVTAGYAYDAASELLSIGYANGGSSLGTLTYGYDLAGRVVARGGSLFQSVAPGAVSGATYNAANRLTQLVAGGGDGHFGVARQRVDDLGWGEQLRVGCAQPVDAAGTSGHVRWGVQPHWLFATFPAG